ncbi:hypothetical protein CLF_102778 [Clonorchis sinensis]|uniref:Uncharacterized protein n=1 Tax=Clonorchis sinensis TaxID=79923 RepID=H2KPY1_CLOSI|nr:hypothetical protein CLF_102778 [Clonorchis sinensis]
MDIHTSKEFTAISQSPNHDSSDSIGAATSEDLSSLVDPLATSDVIHVKRSLLVEPLSNTVDDSSNISEFEPACHQHITSSDLPSLDTLPPPTEQLPVERTEGLIKPMQNASTTTSSLSDGNRLQPAQSIPNHEETAVKFKPTCAFVVDDISLSCLSRTQEVHSTQSRSLESSPCPAHLTHKFVVTQQDDGASDSSFPGAVYRPKSQPATITPFLPVSTSAKTSAAAFAICSSNESSRLWTQESVSDQATIQFNPITSTGRIDEQLLSSAIEGTSGKLDHVLSGQSLSNNTTTSSSFTAMTDGTFPFHGLPHVASNLDSSIFSSAFQSDPVPQPVYAQPSKSSGLMHLHPTSGVSLQTSEGSPAPFTSFPMGFSPVSTAMNVPLPLAPSTSAAPALPPSVSLTLSPITANGDFPPVTLQLPGLPTVILQVLPLPGAKMDEQYTIKVSTPLILSGISGALANGGTMNGGPIMLSIAPGTLPPTTTATTSEGMPSTTHNPLGSDGTTSPLTPPSTTTTSCASTSVSFSLPNVPISHLPSGSNAATTLRLALPVGTQVSLQSPHTHAACKRMRAIAPKPCQKLAAETVANGTSNSGPRSSSVSANKNSIKRQVTMVTSCISSALPIQASIGSAVFTSPMVTSNKGKRVQVLSGSSSASRPGRGRRKTAANACLTPIPAASPAFLSSAQNGTVSISSSLHLPPNDSHLTPQSVTYPTTFTTQSLFVPSSTNPIMTGSAIPSGQMPSTFLFSGMIPPGSVPSGASPYIFQQPIPFANGCSSFPGSLYTPSGPTPLPPSTSGASSAVSTLPPVSSTSLFPPGGAAALATINPATGMITHYPAPCVPMAVPFSTSGSSTDHAAQFGLSLVYSQPNQSAVGFLIPNVSQAGSLVYPVAGQPLLSTPLSTTLSSGSINFGDHTSLGPPLGGSFAAGSLVPGPGSLHSSGIGITSALPPLLQTPVPFLSTSASNPAPMLPVNSGVGSLPVISSASSTTDEIAVMEDDVNCLAKDDLISIAWRLTQMDDDLVPTCIVPDQEGQATSLVASGSENIFNVYDQEKSSQFSYSTNFVVDDVPECSDIYTMQDTQESAEIVLLDAKPSPARLHSLTENNSVADIFTTPEESTGNADIDALLAAAAMVGAASGVGDAQSAVAVPVPTSFTNVTVHSSTSSPSAGIDVNSRPSSSDSATSIPSVCDSSNTVVTTCTTQCASSSRMEPGLSPSAPTDLLSSDLFEFHGHGEANVSIGNFDESDEPPSLVAVLGCNAEDAADLESVLGPGSHSLDEGGPVTESFLNSLVGPAPDDLDLGDTEDADDNLFDADFDVCASGSPTHGVHKVSSEFVDNECIRPPHPLNDLNSDNFDLDYDDLTKNPMSLEPSVDADVPIPSSHQVRALLRNTAPAVLPYRFSSCRNPLISVKDAVFTKLFEAPVYKKRTSRSHRFENGVDDFIGVDFPDAVSHYTTAEQFDEALMLLGPQPSPPATSSSPGKSNSGLLESAELETEDGKPFNASSPTCDVAGSGVTSDKCRVSPVTDVSGEAKNELLEPGTPVEPTREEVERPIGSPFVVATKVSATVSEPSSKDCEHSVNFDALISEPPIPIEPVEENAACFVHNGVELNLTQAQDDSAVTSVGVTSTCEHHDTSRLDSHTGSVPPSEDDASNEGSGYDEEATLAMVIEHPVSTCTIPVNEHPSEAAKLVDELVVGNACSDSKDVDDSPISSQPVAKRYRTRSFSLISNKRNSGSVQRGVHRRRLLSAPSADEARVKSNRTSLLQISSVSLANGTISSVNVPSDSHSRRSYRTTSSVASDELSRSVSCLPVSPLGHHLTVDTEVSEVVPSPSIFGVLASSSVLLEAAVDLVGSDSDISPVKSSLEGLATLDRMLKSCQRQSQQLQESSLSKSSSIESAADSSVPSGLTFQVLAPELPLSTERDNKNLSCSETSASSPNCYLMRPVEQSPAPVVRSATRRPKRRRPKPEVQTRDAEAMLSRPVEESSGAHIPSTRSSTDVADTTQCLLWLPSAQRPLSFGLSAAYPTATSSAVNLLIEGDFERHLPRLQLAVEGRLFPDWNVSSPEPTEPTVTESQSAVSSSVFETTCSEADSVSSSLSLPKQPNINLSARRSGRRQAKSKRQRPKPEHKHKVVPKTTPITEQSDSTFPMLHTKLIPAEIATVNLKVADTEAPFARFLTVANFPTFATVQLAKKADEEPPSNDRHSAIWSEHNVLFERFVKAHTEATDEPSLSVSVASSGPFFECTSLPPLSTTRTTVNKNELGSVSHGPNEVDYQSDTVAHSTVAGDLSGFSAPAFPALRNRMRNPGCSFTSESTEQVNSKQSDRTGTSSSSAYSSTPVVASTYPPVTHTGTNLKLFSTFPACADWPVSLAFAHSSVANTTYPNSTWPLLPPCTAVASLTFGSFAGAAAFRATSFSALAARASSGSHANSSTWSNMPTFSDLAKAASNTPCVLFAERTSVASGVTPSWSDCILNKSTSQGSPATRSSAPVGSGTSRSEVVSDLSQAQGQSSADSSNENNVASETEQSGHRISSVTRVETQRHVAVDRLARARPNRTVLRRRRRSRKTRQKAVKKSLLLRPNITGCVMPRTFSSSPLDSSMALPVCLVTRLENSSNCPSELLAVSPVSGDRSSDALEHRTSIVNSVSLTDPNLLDQDVQTSTSQEPEPFVEGDELCPYQEPYEVIDVCAIDYPEDKPCESQPNPDQDQPTGPVSLEAPIPLVHHSSVLSVNVAPPADSSSCVPVSPNAGSTAASVVSLIADTDLALSDAVTTAEANVSRTSPRESTPTLSSSATDRIPSSCPLEVNGDANTEPPSYPPIRLRLNLKSSTSYNSGRCNKLNKKKRTPKAPSFLTTDSRIPVISASTPTSLSIRLKVPPIAQQNERSSTLPTSRFKCKKVRKGRRHHGDSFKPSDLPNVSTKITIRTGRNDGHSNSVSNLAAPSCTPMMHSIVGPTATPTARLNSTRSSSVSYASRLCSVFSRKIFSTAKQERRSSNVQLSRPWRSGLAGSPRKRGHPRAHPASSVNPGSTVFYDTKRPRIEVKDNTPTPTATVVRGTGRRGRPPSRARIGLPGRILTGALKLKSKAEESRAIRLVIRLGKNLSSQATGSVVRGKRRSTQTSVDRLTTKAISPASNASCHYHDTGQDADSESSEDSKLGETSVFGTEPCADALQPFEFSIATEAETYMDPNQVQIHRALNRAVAPRTSNGSGVSGCFAAPPDDDDDSGEAGLPGSTMLSSEYPTACLSEQQPGGCFAGFRTQVPINVTNRPPINARVLSRDEKGAEHTRKRRSSRTRRVCKRKSNVEPDSDVSLLTEAATVPVCPDDLYNTLLNGQPPTASPLSSLCYKYRTDAAVVSQPGPVYGITAGPPEFTAPRTGRVSSVHPDRNGTSPLLCQNKGFAADGGCGSDPLDKFGSIASPRWRSTRENAISHAKSDLGNFNLPVSESFEPPLPNSVGTVNTSTEGHRSNSTSSVSSVTALPSTESPVAPSLEKQLDISIPPDPHFYNSIHGEHQRARADHSLPSALDCPLQDTDTGGPSHLPFKSPVCESVHGDRPTQQHSYSDLGLDTRHHHRSTRDLSVGDVSSVDTGTTHQLPSPPSSMQQQALALAAAAYATLDPMMAVHQQAKAYYDQWASSLFGNWASSGGAGGCGSSSQLSVNSEPHSGSQLQQQQQQQQTDWINAALLSKQQLVSSQYERGDPTENDNLRQWPWPSNQRRAHASDDRSTSDSTAFDRFHQLYRGSNHSDRSYLDFAFSNLPTNTPDMSRSSQHQLFNSSTFADPSQARCNSRYNDVPGDYARISTGPFSESRVNGW